MVTSALRVSSKPVDYRTQILKYSVYLTDEFRRSDQKMWVTKGNSVMERGILYVKQLLCYSSIEMQIILNFYIVASEKEMSWKDGSKQEKLHNELLKFTAIFIYFVPNAILVLNADEMGRVCGTYAG